MPGEAHDGRGAAAACPEVLYLAEAHRLAAKARALEPLGEERLAAAVFRGYRAPGNQLLG
jgi:hypothetical protein